MGYFLVMPRLVVLGEATAARWVLAQQRMAFRAHVPVRALDPGTPIALYVTRGAFHYSLRDEAQIVAIGRTASPVIDELVEIGGDRYERWCALQYETSLPLRQGLPFRPLVQHLSFIANKDRWAAYLHRTLVSISQPDFDLIRRAFLAHAHQTGDGSTVLQ